MNKIIVQLPANRDYTGTLEIQNAAGKRIAGPFCVCGRSDDEAAHDDKNPNRDPLLPFGDMPCGEYQVAKMLPTGPRTSYSAEEFGSAGVILLLPLLGDAALADANGRHGFFIQGGARSRNRRLRPTQDGSLRLSDRDQQRFKKALEKAGGINCHCLVVCTAKAGAKVALPAVELADRSRRIRLAKQLLASAMAIRLFANWTIREAAEQSFRHVVRASVATSVAAGTFHLAEDKASAEVSSGDYTQQTAAAASWIDSNSASDWHGAKGKCAPTVEQAIRDAGINIPAISITSNGSTSAYNLGNSLTKVGFYVVPNNTTPQPGDVAVIQPCLGHPDGHAAMWDGKQWVSDFKQGPSPYPAQIYKDNNTPYKIYRWPRK